MDRWWPTALERQIAIRYLRGQRGTRSASLQTRIAIGGFAIGVMALIIVLGVMNGLSYDLRDKILIANPDLRIITTDPGLRLDDWERLLPQVRADPDVIAIAPEVSTQTIVRNTADYATGVQVFGLEPGAGTDSVTSLVESMLPGNGDLRFVPTHPEMDVGVAIGTKLAATLGVFVGDSILIFRPIKFSQMSSGMPPPRAWWAEVTGIFETGMYIYDNNTVVMDRKSAQEFAFLGTAVTNLAVRVRESWKVEEAAARLDARLGLPYLTETWKQANGGLFKALQLEKLAMGLVIFIIMVVAAFNIVGTLTMVVAFKTREIGILQAMGMRRAAIRRIFMMQGATIGLVGTVTGAILGIAIGLLIDRSGLITIDPKVYFIDKLPVRIQALDVLIVVAASFAASVLATMHPSRKASALTPVEAIRAE